MAKITLKDVARWRCTGRDSWSIGDKYVNIVVDNGDDTCTIVHLAKDGRHPDRLAVEAIEGGAPLWTPTILCRTEFSFDGVEYLMQHFGVFPIMPMIPDFSLDELELGENIISQMG